MPGRIITSSIPCVERLYFFDAQTGEDRWQPDKDKTAYVPLYIPYWGQVSPVIDAEGNAWFPASGGGGDGGLGSRSTSLET
jgi:hypothetical protein